MNQAWDGRFAIEVCGKRVSGFRIGDVSLERKIKEAIVAVQIEKRYTKREILTLYANQMLFGHGTYGVEAAAHLYFAIAEFWYRLFFRHGRIAAAIEVPKKVTAITSVASMIHVFIDAV